MTAKTRAAASSAFAIALVGALIERGMTDLVVCPGSRSQALALAAVEYEKRGDLTVHVKIDERSAAFFALGLGLETGVPAAVVTTSGTAIANLSPAVLEAHHAASPLLLLTADRPHEMRNIRSPQTTRQAEFFGDFVRFAADIAAPESQSGQQSGLIDADIVSTAARLASDVWPEALRGPAHLNLAFREPLSDASIHDAEFFDAVRTSTVAAQPALNAATQEPVETSAVHVLDGVVPTIVVAGLGAGSRAEEFAHTAQVPLLAEVTSGARFGREAIAHYRELLRTELGEQVQRVIVFGSPNLSREVAQVFQREGVESIVVRCDDGDVYNPGHAAQHVADDVVLSESYDTEVARTWLGSWVVRNRELAERSTTVHAPDTAAAREAGYKERSAYAKAELAAMREPITRQMLTEAIWRATWPHDRLVVGASSLIRVLDSLAMPKNIRVFSNRGLSGIDGTISTAGGIAAASQAGGGAGVTRVLVGDVTALHDVGGMFWGADEPRPRMLLIVGNDGGGTIFDNLEVAQSADQQAFDRVMYTPQSVSFEHLASAYGWTYEQVTNRSELERTLTAPVVGLTLLEVKLSRRQTQQ